MICTPSRMAEAAAGLPRCRASLEFIGDKLHGEYTRHEADADGYEGDEPVGVIRNGLVVHPVRRLDAVVVGAGHGSGDEHEPRHDRAPELRAKDQLARVGEGRRPRPVVRARPRALPADE